MKKLLVIATMVVMAMLSIVSIANAVGYGNLTQSELEIAYSTPGYGNLTQSELECIYSPIGYGNMTQCELEILYR